MIDLLTKTINKRPTNDQQTTNSPICKPYAKAMCTRVLLKDIYKGFLNGGAAPGGRPSLVDKSLRRTLVHMAFA